MRIAFHWLPALALTCLIAPTELRAAPPELQPIPAAGKNGPLREVATPNKKVLGDVACEAVTLFSQWKIPQRGGGPKTPIAIALQLRNDGTQPVLFSRFDTIQLTLKTASGKSLPLGGGRDATRRPALADFRMLGPGESTTFVVDAYLFWRDDKLILGGSDGFGGEWHFTGLNCGAYELGITYANERSGDVTIHGDSGALTISENSVWKAKLVTAPVKIMVEE